MKILARIFSYFLFVLLAEGICMGQTARSSTTIEVFSAKKTDIARQNIYLNGYYRTVNGQTISYHSSHPDAEDALLVRAQRDVHSISWETDTLPKSQPGKYYQFIWLAGIEHKGWGGTIPHEFKLYINDQLWFTFANRKDSIANHWTIPGKDGAELTFDSQMTDKYGDLFGYMFMKIPRNSFQSGLPLIIRVDGEEVDSPDWFMTFEYHFNFMPRSRPEPVLMHNSKNATQELRISLDNLEPDRIVKIMVPNQEPVMQPLGIGGNIFRIPIPSVSGNTSMEIIFIKDKVSVDKSIITIVPPAKRDIYLVPYSHNDIGYTDLQTNVEKKQWANLDEALKLIRETKDYPPEAQFKWNMEILWPLDSYLQKASPERKQELLEAIRNGSIGLNALYVNPLTGLANSTEMSHLLDFAREFSEQYSIPIQSATISDIPGFTLGIVSALAQSNVKYFASGPNSGDRIGYVIDQWGDKPFYWSSQSGKEKVLFWVAGSSYSTFHQGTLTGFGPEKIMKLARKLNENNYPYDTYFLPYTLGDNAGPDSTLSSFVKAWNEKYITPTLIISTHEQMFKDFEKKYGAALPIYSGDFTPYWEDGALSTAYETALNRHSVDQLIQAEAICSIRCPENYSKDLFGKAWADVILWDEHTWGADISVTNPDDPKTIRQWKIKQQFALKADSLSSELLSRALDDHSANLKKDIYLDIFNTNSWMQSDLIILSPKYSSVGDRVVDDNGNVLLSQRLSTGELAVFMENVPPLSSKRIIVKKGDPTSKGNAHVNNNSIENNFMSLLINNKTGAIESLIEKSSHKELVDENKQGLNRYTYINGKDPDSARFLSNVRVTTKERGPLVASLLIQADAPGCNSYSCEIQVIHNLNRVDIINRINKKAIRDKEGVHFSFPFNIPNGVIHYDVASGIVQPEKDQLAGACKNFYSVVSWVDMSNDSIGVTWTTNDAPLIEIGKITAEAPWMKSNKASTTIFSYAMNNYWHTNYKADQTGAVQFRYSLFPHTKFNALDAIRCGLVRRQNLIVSLTEKTEPQYSSLFNLKPNDVIVESVKPIESGKSWLLYLYNPSAKNADIQIAWNTPVDISLCNSFGRKGNPIEQLSLPAFTTQYIRVDKK